MDTRTAIEKARDLLAGKGPDRLRLGLAEVDPRSDGGYRADLAHLLAAHPEVGYAYDPFRDQWTLWRPKTADLFKGAI